MTDTSERWCCYVYEGEGLLTGCDEFAEYEIYGLDSGDPEDVMDACLRHVGLLLGSFAEGRQNTSWRVVELKGSD